MTTPNTILTITSEIRGGGYGARAWVAKIEGSDPTYGYKRAFVRKDDLSSGSGKSGYIHFHIVEPGIYEVRGIQLSAGEATTGSLWSGYIRVSEDGTYERIEKPSL